MFIRIYYYLSLIFLVIAPQAFSSLACENDAFVNSKPSRSQHKEIASVESYRELLVKLAQSSLGVTSLTPQQVKALKTYHQVVRGEEGENGTFARVGNYTFPQRRRIVQFLREVFSPRQVTTLIESGVVEISRSSDIKLTRRVLRNFSEGQKVFVRVGSNKVLKINKILEETNSGWLVEAERISNESGQIITEQIFLIKDDVKVLPLLEADPTNMTQISEKTSRGFVIDILIKEEDSSGIVKKIKGNKVFFSFEKAIENNLLPEKPTDQDYHKLEHILNSYISKNHDQLVQALRDRGTSFLIFMYVHLNPLLQKSFILGEHQFRLASPELESVFMATQFTRERIDSSELNLPLPTNEETQLAEQGYKKNYTGGLNPVNRWFVIQRRLQELRANPHITHIEYFVDQIPHHIAHIRKGLEDHYSPKEKFHGSKQDQLQKLKDLEEEARQVVADGKVTYHWWIGFNFSLAYIISGRTLDRSFINWVDSHLFPLKMAMPVIQGSDGLGIITFNRASLEGVYPVGLINKQSSEVHGGLDAALFFGHDLQHPMFSGNKLYLEYSAGHRLFHRRLLNNIENLPLEKRKKAEAIYFLMTHEYQKRNISYSDWTLQEIREEVFRVIQMNDAGFFKLPADLLKINSLVDIFMEVYEQALQHY